MVAHPAVRWQQALLCKIDMLGDMQALVKEHMEHSAKLCAHLPPWWKTGKKP